uniref:Fc fragment of IgG, low affinity IIb, receptor (CD32) n=1 Tax=Sus scrofa TaxID=9823 RepID=A0A8D0Q997_PIG
MGIPSFLALPAARSDWADCMPCHPLGHMLLWTALLFLAPVPGTHAVLPKAEVKLQPAWINVLQEDSVTLTCQGDHDPGNTTTQWFHNGNFTWTENQPSFSFKARRASSGYYRCQTAYSSLSDPVHLDVISALPGTPKHREKGDTLPEEPANHTDAEEAAKIEAEDTITYSLLLHPEAAEGEAEASDYQNHI